METIKSLSALFTVSPKHSLALALVEILKIYDADLVKI